MSLLTSLPNKRLLNVLYASIFILMSSPVRMGDHSINIGQSASAQTACDTQIRTVQFPGKTSGSHTNQRNINTNLRSNTTTSSSVLTTIPPNTPLTFSAWAYGQGINDLWTGQTDYRWFYVTHNGKTGWVASAVIYGNPPHSSLAPTCSSGQSSSGQINLPFKSGQTWHVCQGYQGTVSHQTTFSLDLTVSNKDFGSTACYAHDRNVNKSAGQPVLAPASGRVFHIGADLICLQLDSNRSMLIGHINRHVANNTLVNKDAVLGTVSLANSRVNGGYAHIHVEGRRSSNCQRGTEVPLTASNGFQFAGVGDLPNLPGGNDYFKRALRRP